ncbi:MAG: pantetheine-phosphate adenylyltransferase [Leptospiraceae bacterium]|nr:pantetheine-phosphate adenylyltransferase [Leptospiraceae bacterium]MDW8306466.1 pantetheine-phosphate adenylyltransferase [Leptospiraceae bacterium]
MRKAIYPGSFDPFTNGHLDIVRRALRVVDHLTIAVLRNTSKRYLLSPEERVELIREVFQHEENIEVMTFEGLLAEFCRQRDTKLVIRGLRAVSDFDYEHAIFLMNSKLLEGLETIFLMSSSEHSFISSSIVKEVSSLGGVVDDQVPPPVARKLRQLHKERSGA